MAEKNRTVTRRKLFKASAAAAAVTIIARHVLGGEGRPSASERLHIAAVGVGGMGANAPPPARDAVVRPASFNNFRRV